MADETALPRRGLIAAEVLSPAQGGGVLAVCDCGTAMQVALLGEAPKHKTEAAVTCNGCGTTHWFAVGPADDPEHPF